MKKTIVNNWNFIRILRLVMGIAVIVQAIIVKEPGFGVAGLLLASIAIFNIGCCAGGSCYIGVKQTKDTSKDITYEEVV